MQTEFVVPLFVVALTLFTDATMGSVCKGF